MPGPRPAAPKSKTPTKATTRTRTPVPPATPTGTERRSDLRRRPKTGGRQTKLLDDAARVRFLDAVRAGAYYAEAADYAGIGETTYYRWMKLADDPAPENDIYREFRESVKQVRAEATIGFVMAVRKATARNWQAAAWWLERTSPDKWGRRARVELTGEGGGPVKVDVARVEAAIKDLLGDGDA